MKKEFISHIEKKLDLRILELTELHGGCISQVFKLETSSGNYVIKISSELDLFKIEEKGLETLRLTNTFFIPKVVTCDRFRENRYLILEFIESIKERDDFWVLFGQRLAYMHSNFGKGFGLDYDNYIGPLSQQNMVYSDGIEFFINLRILPQLRILENTLSINIYSKFDKFFRLLKDLLPLEPPSLLHGDLWSGNYLVNSLGEPALIDPSIYYGSREVDIAMTKLFGGFPKEFYDSYNLEFCLEDGWEDRIDIWNLYPLLVHANLFGTHYVTQIQSILNKYVR